MATWTHGLGGYKNHACRCPLCRAANTTYMRGYQPTYRQRPAVKIKQRASQRTYQRKVRALARLAKAHGLTLPKEGPDVTP